MAAGGSTAMRAAASSIASGRPSRRRQISATATVTSGVSSNCGSRARARAANSATAALRAARAGSPSPGSGSASGASGNMCSAARPRTWRLVTSAVTPGHALQQRGHVVGGRPEMLEVVEHQQRSLLAQGVGRGAQRRAAARPMRRTDSDGDRVGHQGRVRQRRELDAHHPHRGVLRDRVGHRVGDARLPHARRPGDGDEPQPWLGHHARQDVELTLPADE